MGGFGPNRGALSPLCAVVAVVALLASATPAAATTTYMGELQSNWEIAHATEGVDVHRDGGTSVEIPNMPGHSMWFFGDHYFTDANGDPLYGPFSFWPGTRAAVSEDVPGQVPSLSEVPPPGLHGQTGPAIVVPNDDAPEPTPFLPAPVGLVNPATGGACGAANSSSVPVSWYEGVTAGPAGAMTVYDGTTPVAIADASDVLFIPYLEGCLYDITANGFEIIVPRLSMAAYDPARNSILARWRVFDAPPGESMPWQLSLSSPVFADGYLYTYGSHCDSFVEAFQSCATTGGPSAPAGRVVQLRVPQGQTHDDDAYEWRTSTDWSDPNAWSGDPGDAVSILPTPAADDLGPLWARVKDFRSIGKGLLLTEQFSYGAHFRLWQAESPTGPWTLLRADHVSACPTHSTTLCYGMEGHPQLSTGSSIVYTVYDQNGHHELEASSLGSVPDP
jgi:hypothetical protein